MKQFEVKAEKVIGGNRFFIRPFSAFTAANLSGELVALITPILAAAAPLIAASTTSNEESLLDIDAETVAPALANGLASISGDKIETLLKKLLTKHRNITVVLESEHETQTLTNDLANEVFCGDAQDIFILAFEVIKVNFTGFFKKLSGPFGGVLTGLLMR